MAKQHDIPLPLSPSFDYKSSWQQTPYTSPSSFQLQPPHSSSNPNLQARSSSSKRPRGRPPGSKNKSKPQMVITQISNYGVKPIIIEVGAGQDVIDAVIQLALRRNASIVVVHVAGIISNVTLCHPLAQSPSAFTLNGPFVLNNLYGSYLTPRTLGACFPLSSPPSFIPSIPPSSIDSTFGICLSTVNGYIFGGIVAGKVIAANNGVTVTALLFQNPEYHNVGIITRGNIDNPRGGTAGDHKGNSGSKIGGGAGGSGIGGGAGCSGMPSFMQD